MSKQVTQEAFFDSLSLAHKLDNFLNGFRQEEIHLFSYFSAFLYCYSGNSIATWPFLYTAEKGYPFSTELNEAIKRHLQNGLFENKGEYFTITGRGTDEFNRFRMLPTLLKREEILNAACTTTILIPYSQTVRALLNEPDLKKQTELKSEFLNPVSFYAQSKDIINSIGVKEDMIIPAVALINLLSEPAKRKINMYDKEESVRNIEEGYPTKIFRAFGNIDPASKAIGIMATSLNEIYRYFEPSFFKGDFFVCKNLNDRACFEEATGTILYDKTILLNRINGTLIIQVFNDRSKMILWENQDPGELFKQKDTLTYHFNNNREHFFANGENIDITIKNIGSRYATQFSDLQDALLHYSQFKILKSSCKHFSDSWADKNRLFFKGGGSGSNIPEKFMQLSLHEYLSSYPFESRGISMESSREYNTIGDFTHPKPVDIKLVWREANRMALLEVKFMGTIKKDSDGKIYARLDPRANEGIKDIKEYHDAASSDSPTTLLKSYLIVIDGRRNNLTPTKTTISVTDGMHFKYVDIVIDADKEFHESVQGFEKPIRMFAEPICI